MKVLHITYAITEKKEWNHECFGRPEERGSTFKYQGMLLIPADDGSHMAMPHDGWCENHEQYLRSAIKRAEDWAGMENGKDFHVNYYCVASIA